VGHPLDGCHEKIRRAYEYMESLDASILGWGKTNPYTLVRQFDAEAGDYVQRIREKSTDQDGKPDLESSSGQRPGG